MKKLFNLCILIALFSVSCKNRPNTIVEGKFRNAGKSFVKLEFLDINKTILIDSAGLKKDGSFRFKILADQPGIYILKNEKGKIINLLLSPGEKVKIESDYGIFEKDYSVMGSSESELIRQLVEKLSDTRGQIKTLESEYKDENHLPNERTNEYFIRNKEIIKDQRDFSISFILDHLTSLSSIYALYQKISPEVLVLGENRDIQFMKIVADSLSVKYPDSDFVKTFVNDARSAEKRYNNMIGLQKKIMEANTGMPDISYPDASGKVISLSSLEGKTVLLYFWSINSEASRQQNRVFEGIYQKYCRQGFEILAVCVDNDRENWLKLIRFEELSYINTFGPDFPNSENSRLYNLRSIPSNYLIDKEGEIIARDLYGSELEKWLDNKL